MAVLSRLPLAKDTLRDFSALSWRALPDALAREGTDDEARLSTTVHWDLPVILPTGHGVHLLIWHAAPPAFDRPEDWNGRRNHDEAALWLHYLDGVFGDAPNRIVLMGAANLDPEDGNGLPDALKRFFLRHPRVTDPKPSSKGGVQTGRANGGANLRHPATRLSISWIGPRAMVGRAICGSIMSCRLQTSEASGPVHSGRTLKDHSAGMLKPRRGIDWFGWILSLSLSDRAMAVVGSVARKMGNNSLNRAPSNRCGMDQR